MSTQTSTPSITNGLPQLPREEWATHPHFPAHVLLLGSHENFRDINAHLVTECERGAPLPMLEFHYRRWIAAMRSHEAYEERKLYPFLARRFGVSSESGPIAESERGHVALHAAHDEVVAAFSSGARPRVLTALRSHAAVLNAHLEQEEEMVIPALLALSPQEFREYYNAPLSLLLRQLEARGF